MIIHSFEDVEATASPRSLSPRAGQGDPKTTAGCDAGGPTKN